MKIRDQRLLVTLFFLFFLTVKGMPTTWSAAYPYVQKIEGQEIVVKAFPYSPYSGSPMVGSTKVYRKNKLLYSIKRYYRGRIFTSNDGKYLVVVHTSNSSGVSSYTSFGMNSIDYNQTAIEVYRDGEPFMEYSLKDVIDTTRLANNGTFFYWGYYVDHKAFESATWDCEYWEKDLTREEKNECLNGDTTSYCREWIQGCDSMNLFQVEKKLERNSIFVKDNSLFILTNQGLMVMLDFNSLQLTKKPINEIIPDKNKFTVPKLSRKYKTVELPDKFDEPTLKDGNSFELAVSDLFSMSIQEGNEKDDFCVYIGNLVIDKSGNCIDIYGTVYDKRKSEYFTIESKNTEMTNQLKAWATEQRFSTKLIPKGFDAYSFLCIVNLVER